MKPCLQSRLIRLYGATEAFSSKSGQGREAGSGRRFPHLPLGLTRTSRACSRGRGPWPTLPARDRRVKIRIKTSMESSRRLRPLFRLWRLRKFARVSPRPNCRRKEPATALADPADSDARTPPAAEPDPAAGKLVMDWKLLLLIAVAGSVAVGQLYNTQPLLSTVEVVFGVSTSTAGSVVALTQGGYAITLILVTPLADILPRKELICGLYVATIACTVGLALVPNIVGFQVLSFFIGFFTCSGQVLMPLAAELSPPGRMGRNLAIISTGMTLAVLMARLMSGIISDRLGFRQVYWIAAGVQGFVLVLMVLFLPRVPHETAKESYPTLLRSMVSLLFHDPVLQHSAAIALFCFAAFTTFWTTTSFLLSSPPFSYTDAQIGLLAVPGAAGVLMVSFVGRLGDRFGPFAVIGLGIGLTLVSWIQCLIFGSWAAASVFVCAFALDFGVQVQQVLNQMRIFGTRARASGKRSRLNGIYMLVGYSGTFIGSAVGTACYVRAGWTGAGGAGTGFALLALIVWIGGGPGGRPKSWGGEEEWRWPWVRAPVAPAPTADVEMAAKPDN
ncbi:major facilitator superfamily domain-containing protein [Hyaloraphidium curvatum]|nr:major facilitator superfamily domain-containing protein [Hyaloraphidium curvatum]